MKFSTRSLMLCTSPLLLSACASSGPGSGSARPVLYPNSVLNRVGEAQGRLGRVSQ